MGVFDDFRPSIYKARYRTSIIVGELHGGIPKHPDVAEAWIRTRLGEQSDQQVADLVAQTMLEMGVSQEEAIEQASHLKNLNGFKRHPDTGELIIEGRQIKAMLKEAANIAVAGGHLNARGWGKTNKGLRSFLAEHIFVEERYVGLGVSEPTDIHQRFVATWKGTGIQLEEYVSEAKLSFHVATDFDFPKDFWPTVWVIAEENGLGAARSMGFGTFEVVEWIETD